ncbi:MAG: 23S rRNA (adenine(2503)-C(2))-methyltransferase RlmN [bacterium]|nr:23S rRNA (adenine(2503)-C(2))-methyltransferase RlmN [bacterium]
MFSQLFSESNLPRFRQQQIRTAWFDPAISGWDEVTTLPKGMREEFKVQFPWMSLTSVRLQASQTAHKGLFRLDDGKLIESVLMVNSKGDWTACVSSQVGCAMACDFCATGTMGFSRDLTVDEIVDQMRYWRQFLHTNPHVSGRLSNVVMMGMGEPLNNYDAVRDAMWSFVDHMGIGKTKVTVSTVGVKRGMDRILEDESWPDVRVAISLHYADQTKRAEHMPVANQRPVDELQAWCKQYLLRYGNRNHYLTFEYLMLEGKNDGAQDVEAFSRFLKGIDRYKVNLIPWNEVNNLAYNRASEARTLDFQARLKKAGILSTIRKSLGREIDGGCGQLVVLGEEGG